MVVLKIVDADQRNARDEARRRGLLLAVGLLAGAVTALPMAVSGTIPMLAAEVCAHGGETLDLHVSNAPEAGDLRAAFALWRLIRRRRPVRASALRRLV